jgi:Glycosyltransferase family 87
VAPEGTRRSICPVIKGRLRRLLAIRGPRGALAVIFVVALFLALPQVAPAQTTPAPGFTVTGQFRAAKPPPDTVLSASRAARIASRDPKVEDLSESYDVLRFTTSWREPRTWQVDYSVADSDQVVAQVLVDDPTGTRTESWTGDQVGWQMARGYPGAFGHKLNAPYVWLPLAAIFLLGLLDWRRPFRVAHLDLLALLSFGISNHFLTRADIGLSVPLAYPPLLYLLGRMLWIGFRAQRDRRQDRPRGLRPSAPIAWLAVATVLLLGGRVALNLTSESSVIDVGYAGVIGADRMTKTDQLWGAFPDDNPFGDTYGPANYYAYVPFEAALPWSGEWDDLPAARAAAIFFDLATVAGLFVLGGRLRPGDRRQGRSLGVIMAFAWVAYPYTTYALQSNSNDSLVAALLVWALVVFARPVARGVLLGLAAMTKFAPLALAPLFAAGERGLVERAAGGWRLPSARLRPLVYFALAFVAVAALTLAYPAIDSGLATFWDRTVESQIDRASPFSIWGQEESLGWLQSVVRALAIGLAVLVAFVPRRRSLPQLAALGAAVLIAVQLSADHWFYLYIPWFLPLLFPALTAGADTARGARPADSGHPYDSARAVCPDLGSAEHQLRRPT